MEANFNTKKDDKRRYLYKADKIKDFRDLVKRYRKLYSDKAAFKFKKDDEVVEISYLQFADDIRRLGAKLLDLKAKRVAVISENRYEWCVSYLATTTADLIVVPLDKSLPENEIISLIERSKVDTVIYSEHYKEVFKKIKYFKTSYLENYILMEKDFEKTLKEGQKLLDSGFKKYDDLKIKDPKKMSILLFTSGTTTISKAVALSQANFCGEIYALGQMAKVTREDTFLSFLPLHHVYESGTTFLYGTYCGLTMAFCDGIRHVAENLKEYKITGFVAVPIMLEMMYKKIMKQVEKQGKLGLVNFMMSMAYNLHFSIPMRRKLFKKILDGFAPDLRLLIVGGAPMDPTTLKGFRSMGIEILQGYGLTETAAVIAGENDKYQDVGTVGLALPGTDIEIDDPDEDGIGEICVKGPSVMIGYVDDKKETNKVLVDGWFHTGDLGYFNKKGYLTITGRKKNVIVLKNGKNIFPEELEILLNGLPYTAESMVFSTPDYTREGDLTICAEVVYNKDKMKELYPDKKEKDYHDIIWQDIRNNVNKQMPPYKYIRRLIVTDEPTIKTTTAKTKRTDEYEKILGLLETNEEIRNQFNANFIEKDAE